MQNLNVSIIVPAFNAQKTIEKCITSLIDLEFENDRFEIIIVDNNSTDKTAQIIKKYSQVKYIEEKIQGRSYARNTGAKIAKGELLAFVDADVTLDKYWLKNMTSYFNSPLIGGGQGRVIPLNEDGQESLNKFRIRAQNEATNKSNIILKLMYSESPMINSAACMYRKTAFDFVQGFDVLLERHEDIDLAKRVSVAGFDLVSVPLATAHVEYHGEGWLSYFLRSFDEGVTKQDYNLKWRQYFGQVKVQVRDEDTKTGKILPASLLTNFYMVRDEIFYNFIKSILYCDSHFFLKAINSSFKAMGRIWGILRRDYRGKFKPSYYESVLHRGLVLKDNNTLLLDRNLRFVVENNEILYVINIDNNEIINLNSFRSICHIVGQKQILN